MGAFRHIQVNVEAKVRTRAGSLRLEVQVSPSESQTARCRTRVWDLNVVVGGNRATQDHGFPAEFARKSFLDVTLTLVRLPV